MSNLTLPTLTFSALDTLLGDKTSAKIAYATEAVRLDERVIAILHHSSVIAKVGPDYVSVNTCGWGSRTTVDRISAVLLDNKVPYTAAIRKGTAMLLTRAGLAPVVPLTKHTFVQGVLL